jgi:hypothetical protein
VSSCSSLQRENKEEVYGRRFQNPFDNFSGAQLKLVDSFIQDVESQTVHLKSISQSALEQAILVAVNNVQDTYVESDLRQYESAINALIISEHKKAKINTETEEMLIEILSYRDWSISEKIQSVKLKKAAFSSKFESSPTDTSLYRAALAYEVALYSLLIDSLYGSRINELATKVVLNNATKVSAKRNDFNIAWEDSNGTYHGAIPPSWEYDFFNPASIYQAVLRNALDGCSNVGSAAALIGGFTGSLFGGPIGASLGAVHFGSMGCALGGLVGGTLGGVLQWWNNYYSFQSATRRWCLDPANHKSIYYDTTCKYADGTLIYPY